MSAIDIHTHAFPDGLAKRAIAKLEAACHCEAVGNGTVKSLTKSMDKADIDVSVVCAIATHKDQVEGILSWCNSIRNDRIDAFPSVHPDTPDAADWIARFADEGYAGIKLHPMYQDFSADEPRLDPIYAAAQEHGLAVTVHAGRDLAFPLTDDRAATVRFRHVIDKYPDLKLICAHMGGWRMWEDTEKYLIGTNAYLETSFSLGELEPQRAADMIRRHGVERVLLGSDWPWQSQKESIRQVLALPLTEEEKRKILWNNAAKLLGY